MRILLLFTLSGFSFFISCKDQPTKADSPAQSQTTKEAISSILGSWTGMFEPTRIKMVWDESSQDSVVVRANKITIFIDRLEDGTIKGHNVCAGNDRPFSGTYTDAGDSLVVKCKEPGDNKFDGSFEFAIVKSPSLSLHGTWKSKDPSHVDREYNLERKNFKYDSWAGEYAQASNRLLTENDVNNLLKEELRIMRNGIYARHGYSFKIKDVRQIFDEKAWYMPIATDVRSKLSPIELKNQVLIKKYEKYAEDSYDDYGR